MKKGHHIVEGLIDWIAMIIVIEWFLKLIGVSKLSFQLTGTVDNIFIFVLFLDLLYHYLQSENRQYFIKEHWLEFICLIPMLPIFRLFRFMRIIRKSRLKNFIRLLGDLLKTNSLNYVISVVIILALVGGGLLYRVEPSSSIPTAFDGVWLAFVTMTTVGYGDFAPVTYTGRIITMLLMVVGVGFLGVLSGSIASFFTNRTRSRVQNKRDLGGGPHQVNVSGLNADEIKQVEAFVGYLKSKK